MLAATLAATTASAAPTTGPAAVPADAAPATRPAAAGPVGTNPAAPALPAGGVADAVRRLLANPRDEKQREAFKDPRVQNAAWPALEAVVRGGKGRPLIGGIILPEDDPSNVLEAMAAVNGPRAADLVAEMARNKGGGRVRRQALYLIGTLKLATPAARQAVREGLADPDDDLVGAALSAAGGAGHADAGPIVLALLMSPRAEPRMQNGSRSDLRRDALRALAGMGYAGAVDNLLAMADHRSAGVRAEAAAALGGSAAAADAGPDRRRRAADRLAALLDDPNADVRSAAGEALADLGDRRGGPPLAYDLGRRGLFDPARPPHGYLALFDTVRRLEKLAGADYGSALGRDAWDLFVRDDNRDQGAAVVARVKTVLADLRAHGITADGLPRVPDALTAADKATFDGWFETWLVDPRGGRPVAFTYLTRSCWGSVGEDRAVGWQFPAAAGRPARVRFLDGAEAPAPAAAEPADWLADARRQVDAVRNPPPAAEPDDPFAAFRENTRERPTSFPACVAAAWAYRLGDEKLAAGLLFVGRGAGDAADEQVESVRAGCAWAAFSEGVNAYIVRDDDAASAHLERLRRLYPEHLDAFGPGTRLLAELARRKAEGSYVAGAAPATLPATLPATRPAEGDRAPDPARMDELAGRRPFRPPAGFDTWPADRRAAWLVRELQEVDARQMGQPGGVDVSADPRVEALVALGDAAVPALIDSVENDERLTRSVSFWRDFSRQRTIIGVRECALSAVQSILGTAVFEPASTGDNFTTRGEGAAKATARRLRAYWDRYGRLPYAERMMTVLADPKTSPEAALSAASALAHANEERRIGTMVWTGRAKPKPGPNPVVDRFRDPTVAQTMLAAFDRASAAFEKDAAAGTDAAGMVDYRRRQLRDQWVGLLVDLGDQRATPLLAERYAAAKDGDDVRRWALACAALGEPRPADGVAAAFKAGTFALGRVDPKASNWMEEPGNRELTGWVDCLRRAGTPAARDAVAALADPAHPYHAAAAAVVRHLLVEPGWGAQDAGRGWSGEPVLFRLARPLLDDLTPTGTRVTVRDGRALREEDGRGGFTQHDLPAELADPAGRRDAAAVRVCDQAATALSRVLVGGPAVHPLFADADARLAAFRAFIDRRAARLRPLPFGWASAADFRVDGGGSMFAVPFYPDVLLGGRPATPADVAAGRAVFALPAADGKAEPDGKARPDGKASPGGRPDGRPLPMLATLTAPGRPPETVLVVQAERDAAGAMHYGVIGRHLLREAAEGEVSNIKPLGPE